MKRSEEVEKKMRLFRRKQSRKRIGRKTYGGKKESKKKFHILLTHII